MRRSCTIAALLLVGAYFGSAIEAAEVSLPLATITPEVIETPPDTTRDCEQQPLQWGVLAMPTASSTALCGACGSTSCQGLALGSYCPRPLGANGVYQCKNLYSNICSGGGSITMECYCVPIDRQLE